MILLTIFLAACAPRSTDEVICDRVKVIDQGVLYETLSIEDIEKELQLLKDDINAIESQIADVADEFVHAAGHIMAGGYYDYPTFRMLNYLETYEHMELHVHAAEAVGRVLMLCDGNNI